MRRLRRLLAAFAVGAALVLGVVGAGAAWWLGIRPIPPTSGTLRVPGLREPVRVYRDEWGVPHIFAANAADLFFAQGYLQAGDRLWQMEFQRRVGHGRVSEILGPTTRDTDRFLRTLGTGRAAEADVAALDPETRGHLEAFVQGVNHYIATHSDRLPIEFTILSFTPAPWTLADSLVWTKMMAWDLGGNWEKELLRARLTALLGPERAAELIPTYPKSGPLIIPDDVRAYRDLGDPALSATHAELGRVLAPLRFDLGSNNWVVSGRRAAGGKPLLANDPHLSIQMPSIWWEVGLHGGGFDVVGAGLVGLPGVVIGHNNRIAWGVTNVGPDVQDLFIERVRGLETAQPEYEFRGQWQPMDVRYEVIKIKGRPDERLAVRSTRHGPLINYVVRGLEQPIAFQWTAIREPSQLARAFLGLTRAQNFAEFRAALRDFDAPAQNFVYADVDGNIGYQMPGRIPRRARGQGLVPAPGWTGEYEWTDYIPFDELPTSYNPPSGFIATANNKVINDAYPYFISAEWAPPYRAQRIVQRLESGERLTVADMQALQADTVDLFNLDFARRLTRIQPRNYLQEEALKVLNGWSGASTTESAAASLVEVTYREMVQRTLADELPPAVFESYFDLGYQHHMLMAQLLEEPDHPLWDRKDTPERETRDVVLAECFAFAVDWLGRQFGDVPVEWKWGRLQTATFVHRPLGQSGIWLLERLLNRGPMPAAGSGYTVNRAGYSFTKPYALKNLSSYRQVVHVGDWADSWSMHTTGQSGHPFSRHYGDMIKAWQAVDYHRMHFTEESLQAARAALLTLTP